MRVQHIFTVLHELSSPLPPIDPKTQFRIMDGNPLAYAQYRNCLKASRRRCCYCGRGCTKHGQLDHRLPIARGGLATTGNLVLCCEWCNKTKGSMTDREYVGLILRCIHRMRKRIRHERLRGRQLSMDNARAFPAASGRELVAVG